MNTYQTQPINRLATQFIIVVFLVSGLLSCKINEEWDDCLEECNGPGLIEYGYEGVLVEPFIRGSNGQVTTLTDSICGCDFGLNLKFEFLERVAQPPVRECCGYEYELIHTITKIDLYVIDNEDDEQSDIAAEFRLTHPLNDGTTLKELSEGDHNLDYERFTMDLIDSDHIPATAKFKVVIELQSGETITHTSNEVLFSQEAS